MKNLSSLNIPVRDTDPPVPESGIEIYSKNGIVYSIDSTGLIELLTNSGGVEEKSFVDIPFISAVNLLAYKVISTDALGKAVYASSDDLTQVNRIVGISRNSSAVNGQVVVRESGVLENTGWNFVPNTRLYLGLNGEISTDSNLGLFSNYIGYSLSPTKIFINIGRSIIRG